MTVAKEVDPNEGEAYTLRMVFLSTLKRKTWPLRHDTANRGLSIPNDLIKLFCKQCIDDPYSGETEATVQAFKAFCGRTTIFEHYSKTQITLYVGWHTEEWVFHEVGRAGHSGAHFLEDLAYTLENFEENVKEMRDDKRLRGY